MEELLATQKLEAMSRLAGGVAHDFNNLLTGIFGTAEDIKQSLLEEDPRRHELDDILQACNRAFTMTRQLLGFAKLQAPKPDMVDVSRQVLSTIKLIQPLLGEDIKIQHDLNDVKTIRIDPAQLEQVAVSLAMNAREAMPRGGRLTFKTSNIELTHPAGSFVLLEMQDTGSGKWRSNLAGLISIVNENQGHMEVENRPEQGTTVKLYFPAYAEGAFKAAVPGNPASGGGHEMILVAEDDEIVRRIISRKLRQLGYAVHEARNGQEALTLFKKNPTAIQMVITDMIMPELNGHELVKEVHLLRPECRVLFTSGYPADSLMTQDMLPKGVDFIEKTDIFTRLGGQVRQILDRPKNNERRQRLRKMDTHH